MVAQGTFDDGDSKNVKINNFGRTIGAVRAKQKISFYSFFLYSPSGLSTVSNFDRFEFSIIVSTLDNYWFARLQSHWSCVKKKSKKPL
jgi:heptaprenylglyceryl phosphate synthase